MRRKPEFLTLGTKSKEIFFNCWEQYLVMQERKETLEKKISNSTTPYSIKYEFKIELNKINNWLEENKELKP